MTISEWLAEKTKQIDRLDAELILVYFLEAADRSYLAAHSDEQLQDTTIIDSFAARRAEGEPLAYILGYREFYGRRFFVTPDVLIPRPETETIIDIVKDIKPERILDIGTGSGCIAITCALETDAVVDAVDISDDALKIAQKNAAHHGVKVNFHKSNLLANFQPEPNTLIIANLPYVNPDWDWLNRKSLDFEPKLALYAEQNGLKLIFELINQYPVNAAGLILEADPSQHEDIIKYAEQNGLKLNQKIGFILFLR